MIWHQCTKNSDNAMFDCRIMAQATICPFTSGGSKN